MQRAGVVATTQSSRATPACAVMLGGASRLTAIREQGTLVSSRRDRGELAVPAELPRGLPTVTRAVTKPMLVVHGEGLAVWVFLGSLGFWGEAQWLHVARWLGGCTQLALAVHTLWLVSAATEPLAHWLHVAPVRSWLWQSVLCGWLSAATEPPARWLHVAHLLTARTGSHRAPTCGSHVTSHPGTALQVPSVSSTNWRISANIVPSEKGNRRGKGGDPK